MYKCKKCGNVTDFEEVNVIKTCINQNTENSSDEFFYRENVVCLNCNSTLEDGDIEEDDKELDIKCCNIAIMNEITTFCNNDCGHKESCSEDECVLYRIENKLVNYIDRNKNNNKKNH